MSGSSSFNLYPNGTVLAMRGICTHSFSSLISVGCGSFHLPILLVIVLNNSFRRHKHDTTGCLYLHLLSLYQTYTVKSGDILWSIAVKFLGDGKRWKEIAELNGITDPRTLQVGKVLKIPGDLNARSRSTDIATTGGG